jgi:quercetin dioxygenase-like cupin family protein
MGRDTMLRMTSSLNRRDLCAALSSLAALGLVAPVPSPAQSPQDNMEIPKPPGSSGDPVLDSPRVLPFAKLPVVKTANGESRAVVRGVLPTGEAIEVHETTLLPGHMPHPAHTHRHSELILVREGQLQFIDNGQPSTVVGPGGVILVASNKLHGLKNVGSATANYFVVAMGREA